MPAVACGNLTIKNGQFVTVYLKYGKVRAQAATTEKWLENEDNGTGTSSPEKRRSRNQT